MDDLGQTNGSDHAVGERLFYPSRDLGCDEFSGLLQIPQSGRQPPLLLFGAASNDPHTVELPVQARFDEKGDLQGNRRRAQHRVDRPTVEDPVDRSPRPWIGEYARAHQLPSDRLVGFEGDSKLVEHLGIAP